MATLYRLDIVNNVFLDDLQDSTQSQPNFRFLKFAIYKLLKGILRWTFFLWEG